MIQALFQGAALRAI